MFYAYCTQLVNHVLLQLEQMVPMVFLDARVQLDHLVNVVTRERWEQLDYVVPQESWVQKVILVTMELMAFQEYQE